MAFNAIPGVVKCTIRHSFRLQDCLNTMYFLFTGGSINVLNVTALVNNLATSWADNIMSLLSNDLIFQSILARDLSAENGIEIAGGSGSSTAGSGTDAMPNNVSACVSVRTPFAGRHYRGRMYLGGIPRSVVVENSLDPAFQADITAALTGLTGVSAVAPDYQWVVVAQQQKNPGTPPPATVPIPGGIVTPVNQVVFVDGIVDSQRRRLPNRGK